jgi:uracil-DNA glycosylase family 4
MALYHNHQYLYETFQCLRNSLELLAAWGCRGFNCSAESLATIQSWSDPAQPVNEVQTLPRIKADLGECTRCPLCRQRTHIVFGEGASEARLVFVGEGPGFEEDQQGRPFVGAAGRLLTRIIAAMHLTREQVYICNVVKCRPPENRTPVADEIAACLPFLERQLTALKPEVICTLGAVATSALLGRSVSVTQLRGRFYDYHGIKLIPTFHPAYLLRNPEAKRDVWEDMKKIMALLDIPL